MRLPISTAASRAGARHDAVPSTVSRDARLDGRYLGEAVTVTIDVGLSYLGDRQVELIHVTNDAPSPYRGMHGQPLAGLHHVACGVEDLDVAVAQLTALDLRVVFEARNPVTRVAYPDDAGDPGVRAEVIEGAGMRDTIARGIAETRAWDGAGPVISMIEASAAA